jgi:hypothetical protein
MRNFVTNQLEAQEMIWARLHHLPPIGYHIDVKNWRFVVDEALAPLVRLAWKLAVRGKSVDHILTVLNEEKGFRTPMRGKLGGKSLQISALYKLLTDPFYAGFIRYGERCCGGYHEPLVKAEDFLRVQAHLARRRRNHGPPQA